MDGLTFSVPAGTTYRFALQSSGGLVYSGSGTGTGTGQPAPNTFTGGGASLKVGDFQISGANVGYAGTFPGPTFNARYFTGKVTFSGVCTPVNATAPVISSVPSSTCSGTPITLSILGGSLNGAANWKWYTTACGTGASIGTGSSITVSPVTTTTYFARGEDGCAPAAGPCGSQTITVTPCSCLTPDVATICSGSIQSIRVNGTGPAASSSVASGAISVSIPDNLASGATHTIPVTLPAGATLTGVSVNFNITHTWDSDLQMNLRAPNGQIINLVNFRGGAGDNFTNTTIATGGASLATGTAPFTGTFAPDAVTNVGPTGFLSTASSFAQLLSVAEGDWTFAVRDAAGADVGTLTSWTLNFNYTLDPTASWTGGAGTIFINPAATTPYVAGTQRNVVWVKPTTTTTYTANVTSGPCVGDNNVTINVLATPTVSVTPNGLPSGVCAQTTLVASGGTIYNWSPSAGLNTTTGASVTANPSVNTTYTVNGYGANGCAFVPVSVNVLGTSTSAVISSLGAPPVTIWNEGFNAAPLPAGWSEQNLSNPIGAGPFSVWFQGTTGGVFTPQSGTDFRSAAFLSGSGTSTLSNWLFTPVTTLQNGDQLTFWTRTTDGTFPDRLQIRMSTNGASTNVGATSTSFGDFTAVLLDINPGLTSTGYPTTWTLQTAIVTGLAAPISGRLAFRYFVTSGGPGGANSDNIGIDNVTYQRPPLATCANTLSSIKVDITGGTSPYTVVYTNGTTNFIVPGYVSGTPIDVFPAVTTTYTLVSVTGSNGCVGTGNSGSAIITVTPPPAVTTSPANATTCVGSNATFTVVATPALGTTYQWQVSTNVGGTYTNLANGAPYSGVTTPTLTITAATSGLNQNRYRVVVSGACPAPGSSVNSAAATLFVNSVPTVVTQPVNTTRCLGTTATFTVVASTPNGPVANTYQWQVSTNNGLTYTNITGATAATLSLTNVALLQNNNLYRVVVTSAPCAATVTSDGARLNVNALPVITIATPLTQLTPGLTTTITATNTPAALTPASYSWTLNGTTVTGATSSSIPVDIDKLGTYRATVTDINGCVNSSNTITIDAQVSDRLWIYPNPTNGAFQVRLFYGSNMADERVVTVYNAKGQEVARKALDFRRGVSPYAAVTFDLSNQAAGTYVVKVTQKGTQKVVGGYLLIL